MASWKKHLTFVGKQYTTTGPDSNASPAKTSKYSSWLPEVYSGCPGRLERYMQYDVMDQDPNINQSLNVIANFCTQRENNEDLPFVLHFTEQMIVK